MTVGANNSCDVLYVQLTDQPQLVTMGVLPVFVEFCLWNIAQTDNVTVEQAIRRFYVSVEIFSIFSIEITIFINQVMSVVCPGQPACNDHGQCANSTCICDPGTASHSTVSELSAMLCSGWCEILFPVNLYSPL